MWISHHISLAPPIFLLRPSIYSNSCLPVSCLVSLLCTVSFSVSCGLFMDPSVVVGKLDFTRRYWCCRLSTLSLSLVVGKRRLFNCLEEKIAVSTSLSPFPTSRLPISFEAKLQFGRTVIFQIRPCSNAQKKRASLFSFHSRRPQLHDSCFRVAFETWCIEFHATWAKFHVAVVAIVVYAATYVCHYFKVQVRRRGAGKERIRGRMGIAFRKCIICAILTTENRDTLSRKADK